MKSPQEEGPGLFPAPESHLGPNAPTPEPQSTFLRPRSPANISLCAWDTAERPALLVPSPSHPGPGPGPAAGAQPLSPRPLLVPSLRAGRINTEPGLLTALQKRVVWAECGPAGVREARGEQEAGAVQGTDEQPMHGHQGSPSRTLTAGRLGTRTAWQAVRRKHLIRY